MSRKELDRATVIKVLASRKMKQGDGARQLGLSVRQVKRLVRKYRRWGPGGLVSARRGRPSNRRYPESLKAEALTLIRTRYEDFGPTLAHEKLTEVHHLRLCVETLRQWMAEDGIWKARARRQPTVHQLRERRPRFGELIQIDGSPHDWFEGRAAPCTLIVFIDDATGKLTCLRFATVETTEAYMEALRTHCRHFGRPVSLYSDRHGIFRVNNPEPAGGTGLTQFGRAVKSLGIEAIHALSPQAKGRVERANQTLQDRLVKEMRLLGISGIEQANAFLDTYRQEYNRRFAVTPQSLQDAHRPVVHSERELELIFSIHNTRTLSKNLTLQYDNTVYQVDARNRTRRLQFAKVTVCAAFNGKVTLLYQDKPLEYSIFNNAPRAVPLEDDKTINQRIDKALVTQTNRPKTKPASNHPWNRRFLDPHARKTPPPQDGKKGTFLSGTKGDISILG